LFWVWIRDGKINVDGNINVVWWGSIDLNSRPCKMREDFCIMSYNEKFLKNLNMLFLQTKFQWLTLSCNKKYCLPKFAYLFLIFALDGTCGASFGPCVLYQQNSLRHNGCQVLCINFRNSIKVDEYFWLFCWMLDKFETVKYRMEYLQVGIIYLLKFVFYVRSK
jgi:hypothetical protein